MSTHHSRLPVEGPGQDDCGRLMYYLRDDYIRRLRVEVNFYHVGAAGYGIKLEAIDDGLSGVDGEVVVNVWASRALFGKLTAISTAELHDLLLSAHRAIERYFELGEAAAPIRRVI